MRVGVISGPESLLMEEAKKIAEEEYGIKIKILLFNDYRLPNIALHEGSLDANMFQHVPYLEEEMKHNSYQFTVIGKTFHYPSAVYSRRWQQLAQLPLKAQVALPNDPTNEGRALRLLERAGLIQLDPQAGYLATPRSIQYNPKQLQFKELDAAQLSRALPDVDIAVINTNYAILAGLYPHKHALWMEDPRSNYANVIVVRTIDKNNTQLEALVKALHSPKVVALADKLFHKQAIPAW